MRKNMSEEIVPLNEDWFRVVDWMLITRDPKEKAILLKDVFERVGVLNKKIDFVVEQRVKEDCYDITDLTLFKRWIEEVFGE